MLFDSFKSNPEINKKLESEQFKYSEQIMDMRIILALTPNFGNNGINSIIQSEYLNTDYGEFITGDELDNIYSTNIYADIVETYNKHIPHEQAILFTHSNNASKKYHKEFTKAGFIAKYLTNNTTKNLRNEIIKEFRKGNIEILINFNIISEGFDVPDVNNVILARPTNSLILYLQQASRVLRYRPNKKAKIFDHVNNVKRLGSIDLERSWSLSIDDIKSKNISQIQKQDYNYNKIEYKYLRDFQLTKYTDTNTFNKEVDEALALIKETNTFEDNNPARIALINIQNKYQIININPKNKLSWTGYMFKKYNLI